MIAMLTLGVFCFKQMPVDLLPNANIPTVYIQTIYAGAGPSEIETLVSKPLEEALSNIAGIKKVSSTSLEGVSVVFAEFNQGIDSKYAEELVRDKVNQAKPNFPSDTKEPVIKKLDMSAMPILFVSLSADLSDTELYDLADQVVKPRIEQVEKVGSVDIMGGRKREIQVLLDRKKLEERKLSVLQVAGQLGASGQNIPSGKINIGERESVFRSMGDFQSVNDIENTQLSLFGNEYPTKVSDIAVVQDTLQDEVNRVIMNGRKVIMLEIYKQSDSNTIEVANNIKKKVAVLGSEIKGMPGAPEITTVMDGSKDISNEVNDVYLTLLISVILTVGTIFFFLGSVRSTLITSISLPLAIIGSCSLLYLFGCSINLVSLMAMSLAVGLLVDDSVVAVENIYRRIERGDKVKDAVVKGGGEIQMSLVAITMVVISVFLPISFMKGIVGQFLKQYGLTVCITMAISLFVAITIVPMLIAYVSEENDEKHGAGKALRSRFMDFSERFQAWLTEEYEKLLGYILSNHKKTIVAAFCIFAVSSLSILGVSKNFIPDFDNGTIIINIEREPGMNLDGIMPDLQKIEVILKKSQDVERVFIIGGTQYGGESNKGMVAATLKEKRNITTDQFRDWIRTELKGMSYANPIVNTYSLFQGGVGQKPVMIDLMSSDEEVLEKYADIIYAKLKNNGKFRDVDTTLKKNKPEFQISLNESVSKQYGVNSRTMGLELRGMVEGLTPAKYRQKGYEYDVRVRMKPDQRDLKKDFGQIRIPNMNYRLVRLADIAQGKDAVSVASIERQNRSRHVQVTADLAPGVGLGDALDSVDKMIKNEVKLPPQVRYEFSGNGDYYREMMVSAVMAVGFSVLFIFLILSSLYESFITPFTILISLPLALCGAFVALFVCKASFDMFAIFGLFMLLGVAGKNSILLTDFILQRIKEGNDRSKAIILAGRDRLRPILMTSFALIAGAVPIAIGINKSSQMRSSMGIVIIGGLISSTLLTLVVIPAVFVYIDEFRIWISKVFKRSGHKELSEQIDDLK
jgi:HAE1 family hydrophobic/amphiphilic exporter-1